MATPVAAARTVHFRGNDHTAEEAESFDLGFEDAVERSESRMAYDGQNENYEAGYRAGFAEYPMSVEEIVERTAPAGDEALTAVRSAIALARLGTSVA